jgi:tRNA (cmo5U34)-methyltransferase
VKDTPAKKDFNVGTEIGLSHETWSFAEAIENFDDHILQSVPNCQQQREYIASLSRFFLHGNARVYEIGVSTGELAKTVLERTPERHLEYIGLDVEPSMIEKATQRLQQDPRFKALCTNAVEHTFEHPALVISYYTLQFIPLLERKKLLTRIFESLEPGGALILYEKTLGENAQVQDMISQLYFDFKSEQGLSSESILNKALALRGVSMPLSLEENRQLLQTTGFKNIEIIYRAYAFAGYLALKPTN